MASLAGVCDALRPAARVPSVVKKFFTDSDVVMGKIPRLPHMCRVLRVSIEGEREGRVRVALCLSSHHYFICVSETLMMPAASHPGIKV